MKSINGKKTTRITRCKGTQSNNNQPNIKCTSKTIDTSNNNGKSINSSNTYTKKIHNDHGSYNNRRSSTKLKHKRKRTRKRKRERRP